MRPTPSIESTIPTMPRLVTRSMPNRRPNIAIIAGDAPTTSAASPARVRATPSMKNSWYTPLPSMPSANSTQASLRVGRAPPNTAATTSSDSAASTTRVALYASGGTTLVPYLMTL